MHEDPVSGNLAVLGYRWSAYDTRILGEHSGSFISIATRPDDCHRARREFLEHLFSDMKRVAEFNVGKGWGQQKSLQTYVFDQFELTLFNRLLFDSLKIPELAPISLNLIFHFQETVLSTTDKQPANEVIYPVIILSKVIREQVAVPVHISFRLPDILEYLPSSGFDFRIIPSNFFWFYLSNIMKSDALFKLWKTGDTQEADSILNEINRRLTGTDSVLGGIRAHMKDQLVTYPPRFSFPSEADFQNVELSRLGFIVRYESFMGAMAIREERCLPFKEQVDHGSLVPLTY